MQRTSFNLQPGLSFFCARRRPSGELCMVPCSDGLLMPLSIERLLCILCPCVCVHSLLKGPFANELKAPQCFPKVPQFNPSPFLWAVQNGAGRRRLFWARTVWAGPRGTQLPHTTMMTPPETPNLTRRMSQTQQHLSTQGGYFFFGLWLLKIYSWLVWILLSHFFPWRAWNLF